MSRDPEAHTRPKTSQLTHFTPDGRRKVQPMQVSCAALAGQPLSCRPNRGGKLKSPSPNQFAGPFAG